MINIKEIYFINKNQLAKKLSSNEIGEYLALKHFIVFTVLSGSFYVFPFLTIPVSEVNLVDTVIVPIILAAISVFSILWIFKINNKGDGRDFFKRFFCLILPATIQATIVVYVPALIIVAVLLNVIPESEDGAVFYGLWSTGVEIIYTLYFYMLMGSAFRVASKA